MEAGFTATDGQKNGFAGDKGRRDGNVGRKGAGRIGYIVVPTQRNGKKR